MLQTGAFTGSLTDPPDPGWKCLACTPWLRSPPLPAPLTRFALGLTEAINHAFGNPREEWAHLPPLVVVRPYRDRPRLRSR